MSNFRQKKTISHVNNGGVIISRDFDLDLAVLTTASAPSRGGPYPVDRPCLGGRRRRHGWVHGSEVAPPLPPNLGAWTSQEPLAPGGHLHRIQSLEACMRIRPPIHVGKTGWQYTKNTQ
ncbi:hypothetical protein EJB05_02682, partial [Eragrostis curvula]